MVEAFKIAQSELETRAKRLSKMRDRIINGVLETVPDSGLTGHRNQRLANHVSFVFKGVDGNALLMLLDDAGFACSSGSACKTGDPKPSEVLLAIGLSPEWALGSLRVTLGLQTSDEDIEGFLTTLPQLVSKARTLETA
jgi:cysteine desulfurase